MATIADLRQKVSETKPEPAAVESAAAAAAPEPARTPVAIDPSEVVGPDGTVIIVVPKAKHGPLWTPESFGKIIRNRLFR